MPARHISAPSPDLRIVRVDHIHPHEDHDIHRALPLIERIKNEEVMINPPIVSPIEDNQFVVLDGANRCYAFFQLQYPHILVQVSAYDSGYVELDTWKHIISHWDSSLFESRLAAMENITLEDGVFSDALAYIQFRAGTNISVKTHLTSPFEKNSLLRQIVTLYQQNATLNRTAIADHNGLWSLYPDAFALISFPHYSASDILEAVQHQAYLPSGVTRHIIHGRALRVNYPMERLRATRVNLTEKNNQLQLWIQERLANRRVRYYAETTYQFDE